jgi:hypothetical protein
MIGWIPVIYDESRIISIVTEIYLSFRENFPDPQIPPPRIISLVIDEQSIPICVFNHIALFRGVRKITRYPSSQVVC